MQVKFFPIERGNSEIPVTSISTEIEHFTRKLNSAVFLTLLRCWNRLTLLPGRHSSFGQGCEEK